MRAKGLKWILAMLAALGLATHALASRDEPVVAVASGLQFAVEALAADFTRETGQRVRLSFGSTGNFSRQIRAGAPYELLLAADEQFVLDLHRDGFTPDAGRVLATGRLVMVRAHRSSLRADGSLMDLRDALAEGRVSRFAIANPEHAPYGMRARESLQHAGLWQAIQPHLVFGENVSQAAQFALSGNADGALVAWSLALAPGFVERVDADLVPESAHAPLHQRMALTNGAGPVAAAFYAYLSGEQAQATLARHGFTPAEDP
jgi:molybdate transport system substrate-binding protein